VGGGEGGCDMAKLSNVNGVEQKNGRKGSENGKLQKREKKKSIMKARYG